MRSSALITDHRANKTSRTQSLRTVALGGGDRVLIESSYSISLKRQHKPTGPLQGFPQALVTRGPQPRVGSGPMLSPAVVRETQVVSLRSCWGQICSSSETQKLLPGEG